jgi:protein-L-isoaspartate O-methyltransferase
VAEVLATVTSDDLLRRRAGFDRVARLYDQVRPSYPPALFDDLAELTGIGRVLEIGCGTGQATVELARRGHPVVAVELGPNLAEIARANLADFDRVRVETGDFERWTTTEPGFDVVFAATAFHWLTTPTRHQRTADLLRPGGALATVTTHHVAGGTAAFFVDAQLCYRRYDPTVPPHLRLSPAGRIPLDPDVGPRYGRPVFRRYEWDVDYRTAEYLDVLRTYSPTLALSRLAGEGQLREIGALIDGRYGGRITKRYLVELRVAPLADGG